MKHLAKSLLFTLSAAAFSANAERLYDVQLEVNGSQYALYNQTFPIELTIDECGSGTLDYILYDMLQNSNPLFGRTTSEPWVGGVDVDPDVASISCTDSSTGTYTLTLSRPFAGTVEVNGTYEGESWHDEYDETTGELVPVQGTEESYFTVYITVPSYEPPGTLHGVAATESDVGKIVGADGRVYNSVSDAESAGTSGEAMIAYIDISAGTGLAVALADASASATPKYQLAQTAASDWSGNHWMTFGGWQIPSVDQLKHIFAAFGGADYATQVVENETYSAGSFHSALTAAGGSDVNVRLGEGRYYTSTEAPSNKIWCYDFSSSCFAAYSQQRNSAYIRMCLVFDMDFIYGYNAWSGVNSFTGAWDAKDASGIYNVFRYAFDVPSGDFPTPLLSISFNADKSAVITTPELVNTEGFEFFILASDDIAGTENVERYPLSPDGATVIQETGKQSRFFRLKVEVAQPPSNP